MEEKIEKYRIENKSLVPKTLELEKLDQLLKGQKTSRDEVRLGFIGLAQRNEELIELNQQLVKSNAKLEKQLKIVVEEADRIKREREETESKRQARKNRRRLPKREPMAKEIYNALLRRAEGPGYLKVRLRLAFCILAVTGVRISELRPLKVNQLKTLATKHWIAIDRIKKGPSNHKAFLTSEGKKIIKARRKDFEFMFLIKHPDSFIFTSELNHDKMLSREALTKDVNKIMHAVSKQFPGEPNITSHSFRIGYITELWRDSKDIEFVKQTIGHRKLDTTSTYINKLSEQDRQDRIESF